ncbi:hypothetical protein [Anaerosporomusa subterranea]
MRFVVFSQGCLHRCSGYTMHILGLLRAVLRRLPSKSSELMYKHH